LAIDTTNIGSNFTVLSLHVLYQGCGIPVAWKIVKGRAWIESSYRDVKSDGWQWHKTRLREPARAERIWLAMAVATLWTVTVGSDEQRHLSNKFQDQVIDENYDNQQLELEPINRTISCFLQGLINIVAD